MKKLLSLIVALALVLTTMSTTVFAAVSDDVTDAKVKAAVDRLVAFGLVNGLEDGKYHPENKLTRAEASKLLVIALGLGSAADAAKGSTQFSDVAASHWASGYINVAAGQGIVKGVGDGQFSPESEVTYAQIITMLVRSLGYKDEFLPGTWPGNYVAKAADLDIDDDVSFSPDGVATRGAAAILIDNTLDANTITVSEYSTVTTGVTYKDSGKTLLEDKLGYEKVEDIRLLANKTVDQSLDADEVELLALASGVEVDGTGISKGSTSSFTVDSDSKIDTNAFLGYKVKAYFDGDEIVYIEKADSAVFVDYINDVAVSGTKTTDLYLKAKDKGYAFGSDAQVYLDGDSVGTSTTNIKANTFGYFVVENNKIVYARILDVSNPYVVTDVDTTNNEVTGLLIDSSDVTDDEVIDLGSYDAFQVIAAKDGTTLSLSDVKANDVVYVTNYEIDGDDTAILAVVSDNEITGEFGNYKSDSVEIDGKYRDLVTYNATRDDEATDDTDEVVAGFTTDAGDNYYNYTAKFENDDILEDLDGADVTAYTDVTGRIVFITSEVEAASGTLYAVVTEKDDSDTVTVFTSIDGKGVEKTYDVEEKNDIRRATPGAFIKFKLTKDGLIKDGSVSFATVLPALDSDQTLKFTKDTILNGSKNYSVEDSKLVFDYADFADNGSFKAAEVADGFDTGEVQFLDDLGDTLADDDDISLYTWKEISDSTLVSGTRVAVFLDGSKVDAAYVFNKSNSFSTDTYAAYIIDKWRSSGDYVAKVKIPGQDIKEYVVDGANSLGEINKEDVAVVTVKSNGKIKLSTSYTDDDITLNVVTGWVYARSSSTVTISTVTPANATAADITEYTKASDIVVYDGGDVKTHSNLTVGTKVKVIVQNGIYVKTASIVD